MMAGDLPRSGPSQPRFEHKELKERLAVVRVHGELDIGSADALRRELDAAEAQPVDVVRVDASDVGFLDSAALGVILGCAQRMSARGGRLELVCDSPAIRRVLDMTMISRTVHLLP
jgi:anti-sigma B factor antagonist